MKTIRNNFYQRGVGEMVGIGSLIVFGLIIAGILWLFGFNFGMKNEGIVDYSDCRQTIYLESGSWRTYFHSFTCNTRKTQSGAVMDGECVSIKNDGFFGNSHTCAIAYVYEIKSTACEGNIKDGVEYPYLGYDDNCYTTPQ